MMKDKDFATLVDSFEAWLRVPKIDKYEDWTDLDTETKAALLIAAKRIETEYILKLAKAVSGTDGYYQVASVLDGGDAFVQYALSEALDEYELSKAGGLR